MVIWCGLGLLVLLAFGWLCWEFLGILNAQGGTSSDSRGPATVAGGELHVQVGANPRDYITEDFSGVVNVGNTRITYRDGREIRRKG